MRGQASHLRVHWLLSVNHTARLVFNLHWLASSEAGFRSLPDMADGGGWRVSAGAPETCRDLLGLDDRITRAISQGGGGMGVLRRAVQRPLAQACFSLQPPRPCEAYRAEWKLCRSARHFLHHYYVHGERPACEQWRRDLASCREWEERRSADAQVHAGAGGGAGRRRCIAPASECTRATPSPRFRPRDTGEEYCLGRSACCASFLLKNIKN